MQINAKLSKDKRIEIAAEEIFSKYGYEKATLDQIISLADVGKGTVYKYFGNKEHFYKLVSAKNEPFVEALRVAVESESELKDKLTAYFKVMVEFYQKNCALWQIIYYEMLNDTHCTVVFDDEDNAQVISRYSEDTVSDEVKERFLRYHNLLTSEFEILYKIVVDGMKEGTLKSGNARIAGSHLFFGVAMGIFHHIRQYKDELTTEAAAKIIVDRFLYGEAQ